MRLQALRWLAAGALLALCCFPSHTSGQTPASKTAKPGAQSPQWIIHQDPHHYSVESPPGWTASPDRQRGWVQLTGTQGEGVLIWPVFIPGLVDTRFASLIHLRLAAASPYNAQWESPQSVAPNALRARGASGSTLATSVFTWVSSPRGLAGSFYVVAAREPDYRRRQDDFARILQSFRIMGAEAPGAAAPRPAAPGEVQYARFSDPVEGAFTMDVPAGWKTQGGLARHSPTYAQPVVESVSPDGQIRILVGDAAIPPFIDPSGDMFLSRLPEGSVYGTVTRVRRFTPGALFCRDYVLSRLSQICPNPQITEVKDRPDLLPKVADHPLLPRMRVSIGEVWFRCGDPAQPKVGLCAARTEGVGSPWAVNPIIGYLAPPEKASTARAIMDQMVKSRRFNPQWQRMQNQVAGASSEIASLTANEIAEMAARSQRARDAVDDEIARRRSNATLGTVDLVDPQTGRRLSVESGSHYYWVDPRGLIVGTNTATVPTVDFRALLQLP